MKKISRLLALVLVLVLCLAVGAQAKEVKIHRFADVYYTFGKDDFSVKYNGYTVAFPDAQPRVNADNRTLVPIRFVAEKMGADVAWNGDTKTATISKDGTVVEITIGNKTLKVNKNGEASTVTMDTVAEIAEGRTLVPVRFVAEALGAWVGYSDLYNTAQIYDDVLTPEEIDRLRAYDDPTFVEFCKLNNEDTYGTTDESWAKTYPQINYFTGTGENGFANANEWALERPEGSISSQITTMKAVRQTGVITGNSFKYGEDDNLRCSKIALAEAIYGIAVQMEDVNGQLRCDLSTVASSRHFADGDLMIRGVLTMDVPTGVNTAALGSKYGISGLEAGKHYENDVEVKIVMVDGKMGAVGLRTLGGSK